MVLVDEKASQFLGKRWRYVTLRASACFRSSGSFRHMFAPASVLARLFDHETTLRPYVRILLKFLLFIYFVFFLTADFLSQISNRKTVAYAPQSAILVIHTHIM
jgi:hypothetical protein